MLRKIFKYWLSRDDGMYSGWDLEFINQSRDKKKKRERNDIKHAETSKIQG